MKYPIRNFKNYNFTNGFRNTQLSQKEVGKYSLTINPYLEHWESLVILWITSPSINSQLNDTFFRRKGTSPVLGSLSLTAGDNKSAYGKCPPLAAYTQDLLDTD